LAVGWKQVPNLAVNINIKKQQKSNQVVMFQTKELALNV